MLDINWTFLTQLGFFLAFMAIVNLFLFRPMRAYLARRQRTIDNLKATAGGSESALAEISAEYTRKIARGPRGEPRPAAPTSARQALARAEGRARRGQAPGDPRRSTPRRTSWPRKSPPPARTCSARPGRSPPRSPPRSSGGPSDAPPAASRRRVARRRAAARHRSRSPPRAAATRRCPWTRSSGRWGSRSSTSRSSPSSGSSSSPSRSPRPWPTAARPCAAALEEATRRPARGRGPPRRVPGEGRRPRRRDRGAAQPGRRRHGARARHPRSGGEGRRRARRASTPARPSARRSPRPAPSCTARPRDLAVQLADRAACRPQITAADQQPPRRRVRQGDGGRAMIARTIGRRYAKALMAVAVERGETPEDLLAELEDVAVVLAERAALPRAAQPTRRSCSPTASRSLEPLPRRASQPRPLARNFLRLLLRKGRLGSAPRDRRGVPHPGRRAGRASSAPR